MVRELVVLGTSSSVPTRHRNHNGYLLHWDDETVLFDPGEGTQRQLLLSHAHASRITRICITHFHGDHCLGLAGIAQRLSVDEGERTVDVYFPEQGVLHYEAALTSSVWDPEGLTLVPHPSAPGVLEPGPPLTITAAALSHSTPTLGYRIEEPAVRHLLADAVHELGIDGPLRAQLETEGRAEIGGRTVLLDDVSVVQPGNRVAFVMDTRACPEALALAQDVDLLVCESTFLSAEEELAQRYGHMTADQAGRLAAEAGARRLVLAHFSQRYPDESRFVAEAARHHDDVVAARDLETIDVPHRRHLDEP